MTRLGISMILLLSPLFGALSCAEESLSDEGQAAAAIEGTPGSAR